VGNLANLIVGVGFTVPAAMIYQQKKSLKGAMVGMSVGIITMAVLGAIANYWLLIPAYTKLMPLEAIIAMASEANPNITDVKQYVLYAVIPFNVVKAVVVSMLTLPLYKRISFILHK
jgi:riboflavin transporter FmnP